VPEDAPAARNSPVAPAVSARLLSLDTFRGIVMLLLIFFDAPNGWTSAVKEAHSDRPWLVAVVAQFEHVEWEGLALWDMIQPAFMFAAGASVAFSFASRSRRGHSYWRMLGRAVYRALLLILLGVFLRSVGRPETRWTFEDVVSQIGLGYVFLFLLWNRGFKIQLAATVVILVGYWALFAFWPLLGPTYDYAAVSGHAYYDGFFAHWNKNAHPAHYFDQWLLNLFPRSEPFAANEGGYNTLNFVPSLATMILGLMAGELLRSAASTKRKFWSMLAGGLLCGAIGAALHYGGVCPIVKKIWTPSLALFSGGICLVVLAMFYAVIDIAHWRRWTFPAVVVGQNPLAAYAMIHLIAAWFVATIHRHFGPGMYTAFGAEFQPLLENLSVGAFVWLVCWWMYRRQIFLRL